MELPQSRPYEAEGRRKSTHDFLSTCSSNNSTVQPDPMPSSQGGYLKTRDFLQPLERVGTRACTKDGIRSNVDTLATEVLPHVLPGGIGTYTVSHIPYTYHHHNQRVPKSEVSPTFTTSQASSNEGNAADENSISNCNSIYAASGMKRTNIRDSAATIERWQGIEQRSSFSSRSSLQTSGLKIQNQSFMDMIRSARGSSPEEEFFMKKQNNNSTSKCERDLRVKVGGKVNGNEQKPNTPRSKHSATEQRRRSKINDRFQMLRKLIPNSDLKRDKASFLLEVIEYIHFLQEKVNKHEVVPYQRKPMNSRKHHQQPLEGAFPVLADAQAVDMEQQCLNRGMETTPIPLLEQRNSFFSPAISQLCPNSFDAGMMSDKLGEEEEEEELSVHKGTISVSSVYSQGLLKTLTETLQTSGVDLSKASISVQINLSKQSQKDEVVHGWVRPWSQSENDNKNNKKQTPKHKNLNKITSERSNSEIE